MRSTIGEYRSAEGVSRSNYVVIGVDGVICDVIRVVNI